MSNEVHWLFEVNINDGQLEDFKSVMNGLIEATEKESGAICYEWCFNEDNMVCSVYERFKDSEAAMTHLGNFGNFAERFLATVTPAKLTVLGRPNDQLKEAMSGLSPVFLETLAGFSRTGAA